MIGLPTETDEDIKGIASLASRAYDRAKAAVPPEQRGNVRVSVSCASSCRRRRRRSSGTAR